MEEDSIKGAKLGSVRLSTKEGLKAKIPAGSKILSKNITINVEEIENGFLITKNYDIKYQVPKKEYSDYCYHDVKIYSLTNPLQVSAEASKDQSLADIFE